MLKLQEKGLFVTNLTLNSPFAGFVLGSNNENDGANMARPVMVISVATNPAPTETIGIGTKTYTFIASGATGDQINVGTLAVDTMANIIAKINEDTADTGVTAYALQDASLAVLVSNVVGTVPAYTPPTFTPDGSNVVAAIAWANVIAQATLENEDYYKIALSDPSAKPIVLVERNAGTYQNFLY